jgi:CheY-like chemotaxis protein
MNSASTKRLRILIVEGDVPTQILYSEAAELAGAESHVAGSIREALQKLAAISFDLIVLDCTLSDGHSSTVAKAATEKAAAEGRPIQVVAISGDESRENSQKMYAAGAKLFLVKPIPVRVLVTLINEARLVRDQSARG